MADFVARGSRLALMRSLLGSVGFVAAGFWLLGAFGSYSPEGVRDNIFDAGAICAAVIFFGVTLIASGIGLTRPPELLRVGPDGFYWSRRSEKAIPWSEITRLEVREYKKIRYFVLYLRDGKTYPSRGLGRILEILVPLKFDGDIWITMDFFDCKYHEILPAFEKFSPVGVDFTDPRFKPISKYN